MQNIVLGTFFVIDDKLQRDPGITGPFCVRWILTVTHHIPRIKRHQSTSVFCSG